MDRQTPPSPASTKAEPLPLGFNELLQHNTSGSYARGTVHASSMQEHSQPASRYGTPGPQSHYQQGIGAEAAYQQRGGSGDMAYHQQLMYQQYNSPYGAIPEAHQPYHTPATSPPTPSRGSDIMGARSSNSRGEINARVLGPRSTRIEKSTPKKKKERSKPPKNMPTLDKPLSELTKDSSIPIEDIGAYVNRSSEERRQAIETGKNPGRVKRPMNAFMLYRKAYQLRAKEWASQHNHQVVSRVCGSSWPLEPEHIRQQYKAWADTERDNHQKAHPNYKFTPAKPHKPPPKFEGGFDDRSDVSDLEDYEWSGGAGSRIRSATHTPGADSDYLPGRPMYATAHPHQFAGMQAMGLLQHHNGPGALDFNAAKPLAVAYDHHSLSGQFYDAQIRNPQQRHFHQGGLDGNLVRRTPSPSLAFQQPNAGLTSHYDPSQYHHKVEQPVQHQQHQQCPQSHQQQQQPRAHQFEHRIDPSLMPQEDGLFDAGNFNSLPGMFESGLGGTQQAWPAAHTAAATEAESQFSQSFIGIEEALSLEQHNQFLRGADEWQVESLPETTHFDTSWVDPKTEP